MDKEVKDRIEEMTAAKYETFSQCCVEQNEPQVAHRAWSPVVQCGQAVMLMRDDSTTFYGSSLWM